MTALLLAAVLWHASAADPFSGDTRLAAPLRVNAVEATLQDVLIEVTEQTGVRFVPDKEVAGDRVTALLKRTSAAESLAAIGSVLEIEWSSSAGPERVYSLRRSPAAQRRLEEAQRKSLEDAAKKIAEELRWYRRLEALTEEQRKALDEKLQAVLSTSETPRTEAAGAAYQLQVLQILDRRADWDRFVHRYLESLTQAELVRLLKAGTTDMIWPPAEGYGAFPEAIVQDVKTNSKADPTASLSLTRVNLVAVRFTGRPSREPALRWQVSIGLENLRGTRLSSLNRKIPMVTLPPDAEAVNTPPPAYVGELQQSITLALPSETRTLGAVLQRLSETSAHDIVADGLWSVPYRQPGRTEGTLGEVLHSLALRNGRNVEARRGLLILKRPDYLLDRWAEPNGVLLDALVAQVKSASVTLDDFAKVAALPDAQFQSIVDMASAGRLPQELRGLAMARPHLQFYSSLSREQKRRAKETGVEWQELNPMQRELLKQAAGEPGAAAFFNRQNNRATADDIFKDCRFRLDERILKMWRPKPPRNRSDIGAADIEEALAYFQQFDPKLTKADLLQTNHVTLNFLYETRSGRFGTGYLSYTARVD
jgi:hypothetical protein